MNRHWWIVTFVLTMVLSTAMGVRGQWETPNRAFHNATSFPLEGRHLTVACESCHVKGVFKGTPNTCIACHWIRRQDDRYALRLGSQCEQCHRPTSWTAVRWDHAATTGMPLNAAHKTLGCDTCHRGGEFKTARLECVSCHREDYEKTRSPNHAAAGFPLACEACHKPSDATFTQARFDHNSVFALAGAHAAVACATCHRGNVFKGTPRDCLSCHRADYDRTQNPNHAAAGFPTTCEICHRDSDPTWRGATASFNHNAFFRLHGVHALQSCTACHRNNQYKGTPRDCVACHRSDYDRTQNPNHASVGFPTSCEQCHRPTDTNWRGASFNHNQFFQLVGVHAQQSCTACHANGRYKGTPRDCVGCHRSDYDRTKNPNHAASGFPTSCEQCHRPTDSTWRGGSFNHSQFFQLVGVHAHQSCTTCHANGRYKGTPRDCVGCHRSDYDRTKNPNHAASGFSTSCEQCHRPTDSTWRGASFNHNQFFPLQGSHAQQPCSACHRNNQYKGTPRDCYACHRSDYEQTRNPNHAASGFPTSCDSCHRAGDSSWQQGTFNHTRFPLRGPHRRECSACHLNASNYREFSCTVCHERGKTDEKHRGRSGYRYDSAACYACHPNGEED